MNTRKLVNLFFKTLFLGGIVGLITSFFVNPDGIYTKFLDPFIARELLVLVFFYVGFGFLSSAVSQTGFFAYLFINRFGLGFFRGFWPVVQVVLIAVVVFDLVYFPYKETSDVAVYWFILMSAGILLYGLLIARIKAVQTKQRAFIPALFVMVVMTSVEWVPALRAEGTEYAWLMIFPLLACNTYQLLILHKLNAPEEEAKTSNQQKPAKNG